MPENKATLDDIIKRRAVLIPSNEIYGTFAGFYDYGPVGKGLKTKIEALWREFFLKREGLYEIETVTILPEIVLKSSGHVENFSDPLVECKQCKGKFKGDETKEGKCPDCGGELLAEVKQFNLMFKTNIGSSEGNTAYARPETAQGIFLDFPRLFNTFGQKLPMGLAQIGKSYRNEISPRKGLIRLREFTQMEIEYFFDPENPKHDRFDEIKDRKISIFTQEEQEKGGEHSTVMTVEEATEKILPNQNQTIGYFLARETEFFMKLGIPFEKIRFKHVPKNETPHYSGGNFDLEVKLSSGWVEIVGNAYRTNYDLKRHAEGSKKPAEVSFNDKKVIPYVFEPSFGLDRTIWCVLENNYVNDDSREWSYMGFPPIVAPYDVAVFPLMKKEELMGKTNEILRELREKFAVYYDASGSIGKRYARSDEIGIPFAITVDYDSIEGKGVTVRFRDDCEQERIDDKKLITKLQKYIVEGKVMKKKERKEAKEKEEKEEIEKEEKSEKKK